MGVSNFTFFLATHNRTCFPHQRTYPVWLVEEAQILVQAIPIQVFSTTLYQGIAAVVAESGPGSRPLLVILSGVRNLLKTLAQSSVTKNKISRPEVQETVI